MAIPTKSQATVTALRYGAQLPDRVDAMLNGNSQGGVVGGTIGYNGAGAGIVTALVVVLTNRGWTVVQDDTAQTLTIT
jgi:hypothetical protein